jgi:hypothetical protein
MILIQTRNLSRVNSVLPMNHKILLLTVKQKTT